MRNPVPVALTLATLFAAGCASGPELEPTRGTPTVEGDPAAAFERAEGVRVEAEPDAWSGEPATLGMLTPMLVTITNDSERPLRVRYNEFQLVDSRGRTYAAVPPFDLEATEVEIVDERPFGATGFHVAPHHARFFPHLHSFGGHFHHDPHYHGLHHPTFEQFELPTDDIITMALPEGVVDPGGKITGFLYFEEVEEEDLRRVNFTFDLVDAETERTFAEVRIPFVAEGAAEDAEVAAGVPPSRSTGS